MKPHRVARRRGTALVLSVLLFCPALGVLGQGETKKAPEPEPAAQAKALAVIQKLFADEFAKAKTDGALARSLAETLFKEGRATVDDPALRYVALIQARDLAVRGGDTTLALAVLGEIAKHYAVDTLSVKVTVVTSAADNVTTPEMARNLIQVALGLLDEAVAGDNYKGVAQAAAAAEKVVPRLKEGQLKMAAHIKKRLDEVQLAEKEFERTRPFVAKLKDAPDDAEANFEIGRFLVTVKGNFSSGLPMLAKGSDAGLKALAQKDLAKPGDAKQQAELGDAWIKLADTLGKLSKKPVQARALHWYEQALPKLEGLTRTRVSKQVEELARLFERDLSNSLGMKLALIPAGKFLMGSPLTELGRNPHEGPQHEVVITKAFYMGKFEVTVGEFRAFVQATGYLTDPEKRGQQHWKNPGWAAADHDPVVNVSWNDAVAFCLWLSKKEGKKYRLPTEAEWEYACRAGTTTATHFGDSMSSHQANFQGGSPYGKAPVGPYHGKGVKGGQYPGNAFGLFDMHGNVWEWVSDFYDPDYYRVSPREDPKGPAKGTSHPLRGGGWFRDGAACRSATREAYPPTSVFSNTGFRVVCEADG